MLDPRAFNYKKVKHVFFCSFQKFLINPYYFVTLFTGLLFLNFYHFFEFKKSIDVSSCFFLVYALSQSFLEIALLAFVAGLICNYCHKSLYYLLINLCLLLIFLHYIDSLFIRFMDFSIFFGINMILNETLDNFIEILHLTGIGLEWWIFASTITIFLLSLLSVFLHRVTMKLSRLKPLSISPIHLITAFVSVFLGLMCFELILSPFVNKEECQSYQRILPWKATLFTQKPHRFHLARSYKSQVSEKQALNQLHTMQMDLIEKPNMYLFIAESLREDFITRATAPHTAAFRTENICLGKTFSNANCTQLSWYSIFHSQYPFAWADKKKDWKSGSIPLQVIKNLGYKIHVYSSAQLKYYGLKELIFGAKNYLVDSYHLYTHYPPIRAAETDAKAIDKLIEDHREDWAREGNLFLIFLDSTHFNYSWAHGYPLKFVPISEEKTNLRISNSIRDIELIKNRYRNAIHYVDSLFGKVLTCLKERELYDRALIVFTGDHGEEFFEEGRLFHASHLSRMQTEPPIYYKLGRGVQLKNRERVGIISSHVDIFPTLLDTLIGEQAFFNLFDGESIFKKNRFPYVVSVRQNGGRNPSEFFIHDGRKKVIAKLHSLQSKTIEIISLKDLQDRTIHTGTSNETNSYIQAHYGNAMNRLFSGVENSPSDG